MPKPKKSLPKVKISLKDLKKLFTLNIGTVMFGILFLYLLILGIRYMTSSHFESYQVTSGPLASNEMYTGLAIREEEVVKADADGYVTYYAREGNKINANGVVFGLSSDQALNGSETLDQEDLSKIRSQMSNFSYGFDPANFNSTYSFKYELAGEILNYAGVNDQSTADSDDGTAAVVNTAGQILSKTTTDGIVLYSMDGYEKKTLEKLKAEDFDQNSYEKEDLKTSQKVKTGDPVYTLVTDERWSLLIPLSDKQAAQLTDTDTIRVKFKKDGMTQMESFSIEKIDGEKYGKIDFNKGLIRYASDRFLDIELVTNTQTGLKVPLSAITTKDFYIVPKDFVQVDESGAYQGFDLVTTSKDGESSTKFVSPTIYASTDDYYYFEMGDENGDNNSENVLREGDAILKPDSSDRYVVGDTGALEGVYCINQGYAVFRRIELIDQNEEYAIVRKDTTYGLSRYDHIAEKADSVKESDIVY